MDKFDVLLSESQLAVSVLINPEATDLELVQLLPHWSTKSEIHARAAEWAQRRLHCVGVIGLVNGVGRLALYDPLDDRTLSALGAAFIAYCESLFNSAIAPKCDFEAFAHGLMLGDDTR